MKQYQSPTGSLILGTLERLTGRAEIDGINDDGEPNYTGSTEIFYDDQVTKTRGDKPWPFNIVYLDENGGEWTFDQLTAVEEECDCGGSRYVVSERDDGRKAVEVCDLCNHDTGPEHLDDSDAAKLAQADGLKCETTYPCYLIDEETGDERLRSVL